MRHTSSFSLCVASFEPDNVPFIFSRPVGEAVYAEEPFKHFTRVSTGRSLEGALAEHRQTRHTTHLAFDRDCGE